ncbi:hypothetical protein, partial [Burkholderia sp. Ap-955]|uniref:hypothetical protein n=1 Tax=Burkholderia sp. Ap-955 TaxID=2608332 RepID=UPI0019634B81
FSAALRFQQQRSEIMNRVSQFVNNFFTAPLRLRGSTSRPAARLRLQRTTHPASLLPRRVSVSAKEA